MNAKAVRQTALDQRQALLPVTQRIRKLVQYRFGFLSTAIRLKLRVALPLLFVALRAHPTFFSIAGLARLLEAKRLQVLDAKILPSGHIGAVARKAV